MVVWAPERGPVVCSSYLFCESEDVGIRCYIRTDQELPLSKPPCYLQFPISTSLSSCGVNSFSQSECVLSNYSPSSTPYTSPIRRINIIDTTRQTTYYVVVDCIRQQLKIDGRGPSGSFSNHQLLVQEVAVVAQLRVSNLTLRQLAAKQSADRHNQRPINTHPHSNPRINSHRNVELCAYCCRLTARSSLGTRPIPQETPTPLNKAEHPVPPIKLWI